MYHVLFYEWRVIYALYDGFSMRSVVIGDDGEERLQSAVFLNPLIYKPRIHSSMSRFFFFFLFVNAKIKSSKKEKTKPELVK